MLEVYHDRSGNCADGWMLTTENETMSVCDLPLILSVKHSSKHIFQNKNVLKWIIVETVAISLDLQVLSVLQYFSSFLVEIKAKHEQVPPYSSDLNLVKYCKGTQYLMVIEHIDFFMLLYIWFLILLCSLGVLTKSLLHARHTQCCLPKTHTQTHFLHIIQVVCEEILPNEEYCSPSI